MATSSTMPSSMATSTVAVPGGEGASSGGTGSTGSNGGSGVDGAAASIASSPTSTSSSYESSVSRDLFQSIPATIALRMTILWKNDS